MERARVAQRPRLLIADCHRMVAETLQRVLDCEFEVVAVAFDGLDALAMVQSTDAECLLLELQLPRVNGLGLIPKVRKLRPKLKILIVTIYCDRAIANVAVSAGANGFVPKVATVAELLASIREVLQGRRHVSTRVPRLSHGLAVGAQHPALAQLTHRQQDIMQLLGQGKNGAEAAEDLGVCPSAVYLQERNIMKRLGLERKSELLRLAVMTSLEQDMARE